MKIKEAKKTKEIRKAKAREKERLEAIAKLRLLDDDLMKLVFENNKAAAELLLRIILERNDLRVKKVITHKEFKSALAGGRTIYVDIYAVDARKKNYNVEVQRASAGAGFHRARYHSSLVDSKMLKAGQDFKELNDSYVIFITESDVIGKGLPLYHIDRIIRETGEAFTDGSHIIYANGAYKDDASPIGKLMHDFRCSKPEDMHYSKLAKSVRYFKEEEGGRDRMSSVFEELARKWAKEDAEEAAALATAKAEAKAAEDMARAEAKAAEDMARAEAKAVENMERLKTEMETKAAEEAKTRARKMLRDGKLTIEEVAEYSGLSLEVLKELEETAHVRSTGER